MEAKAPDVRWLIRGVAGIGGASPLSDLEHEVPTSLMPTSPPARSQACSGRLARRQGPLYATSMHDRWRYRLGMIIRQLIGLSEPLTATTAITRTMATPSQPASPSELLRRERSRVLSVVEGQGGHAVRVFGSVARGEDDPLSDIDLLIELPKVSHALRNY